MKIFILFILLVVSITMMNVGQILKLDNIEENKTINIYNLTETHLVFNETFPIKNISKNNTDQELGKKTRIENIVYSTANWLIFINFEFAKLSFEYGFNNPEHNYKFWRWFTLIFICLLLLWKIKPLIIIPIFVIYLGYKKIRRTKENERKNIRTTK